MEQGFRNWVLAIEKNCNGQYHTAVMITAIGIYFTVHIDNWQTGLKIINLSFQDLACKQHNFY